MSLAGVVKTHGGFCVAKDDLRRIRWDDRELPGSEDLETDGILVEVTKFAFTANNVTYARLGDQIAYWRFFPAAQGWGCIPVWGFGTVVHSRHPNVREGERIYGYFPMATHLRIEASGVSGMRLIDAAEHRRELPRVYNEYVLIDRDTNYDRTHEDEHLVLRPLFSLSFFCAEFLKDERFFDARQIVISSASSKTALGLAFLLAQARGSNMEIVGLTSAANLDFVARHGSYDRVLTYDAISALPDAPAVFVDIAGDAKVRAAVHNRLGDSLKHSARVGFTHWDTLGGGDTSLPGPAPVLFFTPDHIIKRRKEWGGELLKTRQSAAWQAFLATLPPWLVIEHAAGRSAVERIYREVLEGRTPPQKAHVLSIADR